MSEVFFYSSDETGAPALNNVAGSMIGLLDGCLVNGFNAKSVIAATVASGVATLQVSAHGYKNGRKLLLAGADNALLNGVKKLTVVDANHVSVPAAGMADGAATGTITCKRAPIGWTKSLGSATQGVYARPDITASAYKLRVDDSVSDNYARASGVLSPTDFSTFAEQFPTSTTSGNSNAFCYWPRGSSGTATTWMLIGDGTTFYLFTDFDSPQHYLSPKGFGDLVSFKPGDTANCFIGGNASANAPFFLTGNVWGTGSIPTPGAGAAWVAKDYSGLASSVTLTNPTRGGSPMGGVSMFPFPSPVDNGLAFEQRVVVMETNGNLKALLRGSLPGLAEPLAAINVSFQGATISAGGKDYAFAIFEASGSNSTFGSVMIDLTGPWQ